MATEHDYFGIVGDYWSEMIEYGDQRVEVVLEAEDEMVSNASLDAAAVLVGELELVDDELRSAFVSQLDSGGTPVMRFLDVLLDPELEQAEEIDAAIGRDSGDRQVDALRSLSLLRVDLRPEADGQGEPLRRVRVRARARRDRRAAHRRDRLGSRGRRRALRGVTAGTCSWEASALAYNRRHHGYLRKPV